MICLLSVLPSSARAACADPVGGEGDVIYNFDCKTMDFCNGTSWVSMGDYQGTCGPVSADPTSVADLFSTDLFIGVGGSQTITNGIDLENEGGLVWVKPRNQAYWHYLYDTDRGPDKALTTNGTNAETTHSGNLTSFNSDGMTGGFGSYSSSVSSVAWTFRKAPKFFDVVTYTGNSSTNQTLDHNLGVEPGMILLKALQNGTGSSGYWGVYHRSASGDLILNGTNTSDGAVDYVANVTSDSFDARIGYNDDGYNYVAYLFAHDPDPDGNIQCGSYTGSSTSVSVNLGWEPQWLIIKRTDSANDWYIFDKKRTLGSGTDAFLLANKTNAENAGNNYIASVSSAGFTLMPPDNYGINENGGNYVYCAVRKAPPSPVTSVADVFSTDLYTGSSSIQTITNGIDLAGAGGLVWIGARTSVNFNHFYDSERSAFGKMLRSYQTNAESTDTGIASINNDGFELTGNRTSTNNPSMNHVAWTFRKAPKFFDVVTWIGDGIKGREIAHDLGVQPGLIIARRTTSTYDWKVWGSQDDLFYQSAYEAIYTSGKANQIHLNQTISNDSLQIFGNWGTSTSERQEAIADENVFRVSNSLNDSGSYVAYLFAHDPDPDGMIQCGSYTGAWPTVPVVSLGWEPQWLMIKRRDNTGSWRIYDNKRDTSNPISANLMANDFNPEVTSGYDVEFDATGFTLASSNGQVNAPGGKYLYCAIRSDGSGGGGGSADTTPDAFSFTDQTDVATSTQITSNSITIAGIDSAASVSVSGDGSPQININGAGWVSSGTITNGQTLQVRLTSSGSLSTAQTATVDVGGVTDSWSVTTVSSPPASSLFSTDLYTGNGSTQTITNGIDLQNEGGLIWIKRRDSSGTHNLVDTERGLNKNLQSHNTNGDATESRITSVSSNGFSLFSGGEVNGSGSTYVAWTFRKAPNFFDIVTYTGTGSQNSITNPIEDVPLGMVIVKRRDGTGDWGVFHRGIDNISGKIATREIMKLNSADSYTAPVYPSNIHNGVGGDYYNSVRSQFTLIDNTGNGANPWNVSGQQYVAYFFAHNANPDGNIQCDSYTGNGSSSGPTVTLGWEPQWIFAKDTESSGDWYIYDSERDTFSSSLRPNTSGADAPGAQAFTPSSTGFQVTTAYNQINYSGRTYIYCAIRKE